MWNRLSDNLLEKNHIKIPIICMFALKKNYFWKPHTKSWSILEYLYKLQKKEICINKSIYIFSFILYFIFYILVLFRVTCVTFT